MPYMNLFEEMTLHSMVLSCMGPVWGPDKPIVPWIVTNRRVSSAGGLTLYSGPVVLRLPRKPMHLALMNFLEEMTLHQHGLDLHGTFSEHWQANSTIVSCS